MYAYCAKCRKEVKVLKFVIKMHEHTLPLSSSPIWYGATFEAELECGHRIKLTPCRYIDVQYLEE